MSTVVVFFAASSLSSSPPSSNVTLGEFYNDTIAASIFVIVIVLIKERSRSGDWRSRCPQWKTWRACGNSSGGVQRAGPLLSVKYLLLLLPKVRSQDRCHMWRRSLGVRLFACLIHSRLWCQLVFLNRRVSLLSPEKGGQRVLFRPHDGEHSSSGHDRCYESVGGCTIKHHNNYSVIGVAGHACGGDTAGHFVKTIFAIELLLLLAIRNNVWIFFVSWDQFFIGHELYKYSHLLCAVCIYARIKHLLLFVHLWALGDVFWVYISFILYMVYGWAGACVAVWRYRCTAVVWWIVHVHLYTSIWHRHIPCFCRSLADYNAHLQFTCRNILYRRDKVLIVSAIIAEKTIIYRSWCLLLLYVESDCCLNWCFAKTKQYERQQ